MPSARDSSAFSGRILAVFGVTTALAAFAPLLAAGPARLGAAIGVATAALATALSLTFLTLTWNRAVKQLVAAMAAGFLLRMLMVATGLLVALQTGAEPLSFAAGFFGLYFAHQTVEILALARHQPDPRQPEGKA